MIFHAHNSLARRVDLLQYGHHLVRRAIHAHPIRINPRMNRIYPRFGRRRFQRCN